MHLCHWLSQTAAKHNKIGGNELVRVSFSRVSLIEAGAFIVYEIQNGMNQSPLNFLNLVS